MVNHPQLSKDNFALVREVLKSRYSDTGIDFDTAEIDIKGEGRLSFIFEVNDGTNHVFVKIVKPGLVKDNIALSTIATETAREAGQPCPETLTGNDGKKYQIVPRDVEGVDTPGLGIVGEMMTLVQHVHIDKVDEDNLGDDLQMYEALGAYNAQLINQLSGVTREAIEAQDLTISTDDPFGIPAIRELFAKDFDIDIEWTYLPGDADSKIREHTDALVDNLDQSDPVARAFAEGLIRGDHISMMMRLNELEERLSGFDLPETLIHNEVKPANIGALKDGETGEWKITSSFDYDQVGFGPAVKDLGRTISFFAFDKNTGEFFPERAEATIKGWMRHRTLNAEEVEVLGDYIKLGVLTSYPVRSSYLAEELQGIQNDAEVDRLDPAIHLEQLRKFDAWLVDHDIDELLPSKAIDPENFRGGGAGASPAR